MKDVELRCALPSDSEFSFEVREEAFRTYLEQAGGWDEAKERQKRERRFGLQDFYVIAHRDRDVGILSAVVGQGSIDIKQIFILPEYQSQGIGRECMRQVLTWSAAKEGSTRLRVLTVNTRAGSFFRSMGFEVVAETDTHFELLRSEVSRGL